MPLEQVVKIQNTYLKQKLYLILKIQVTQIKLYLLTSVHFPWICVTKFLEYFEVLPSNHAI